MAPSKGESRLFGTMRSGSNTMVVPIPVHSRARAVGTIKGKRARLHLAERDAAVYAGELLREEQLHLDSAPPQGASFRGNDDRMDFDCPPE